MAVLAGEADTDARAVGHLHLTATLDMEEEGIHRIVDPQQLQTAAGERPGLDLRPARQRRPAAVDARQSPPRFPAARDRAARESERTAPTTHAAAARSNR